MKNDVPKIIVIDEKQVVHGAKMLIPYALKLSAIVLIGLLGEALIPGSPFSGLISSIGLSACFIIKALENLK